MIRKLKTLAVILGTIAAGVLFWKLVAAFMWMCYYAGISM